jgi:hypothetical protein
MAAGGLQPSWRPSGTTGSRLHGFLEGPIDGETFTTHVAKVLLPTLRPGDIVIMDNLGSRAT